MWLPFEIIAENLGMSFAYLLPLVAFICGLTFFAIDFKLGVLLGFLINLGIFLWFYNANIYYVPALVLAFIHLILMTFSLYMVSQRDLSRGSFI